MKITLRKAFRGASAMPDITYQDVISFNLFLEVVFTWHPSLGRGKSHPSWIVPSDQKKKKI